MVRKALVLVVFLVATTCVSVTPASAGTWLVFWGPGSKNTCSVAVAARTAANLVTGLSEKLRCAKLGSTANGYYGQVYRVAR